MSFVCAATRGGFSYQIFAHGWGFNLLLRKIFFKVFFNILIFVCLFVCLSGGSGEERGLG